MRHRFFATCARGTEGALRRELAALRLAALRGEHGGVHFEGRMEAGMRACLHSRVAMRVLLELGRFAAPSADALYQGARALPWADWLTDRTTLAVDATVSASAIGHSGYAALKVKDAAVDVLRERLGRRPDVDAEDPDVRIALHLAEDRATLSLDLAGFPLHRRGYRVAATPAPLKESLAAAVLSLGRVDPALPFVDPMAGSGTLAIEHALRARRVAPGLSRSFGFQRWPGYRGALQSAFDRMREEARAAALPRAPAPILARDLHPRAVEALRRNVAAAGVAGDVEVERGDARDLEPRFPRGTLCTNPPYGERWMARGPERAGRGAAGAADERAGRRKLEGFYRGLGEMLARHHGWTAVLLSGSPLLERALPARPEVDHRLWNGPLEVHLLRLGIP
ncbi:MAG TPA: THUMP domain-containing protein [Anaeromyxobacteraceae bacterium]|nr:THUMP domain-containing protein [Anaeromyxobacteraceae bacterium]